jgi:hypothetical protein
MGIGLALLVGILLFSLGMVKAESTPIDSIPVSVPVQQVDTLTPLSIQTAQEAKAINIWLGDKRLIEQKRCKEQPGIQVYILNPISYCQ